MVCDELLLLSIHFFFFFVKKSIHIGMDYTNFRKEAALGLSEDFGVYYVVSRSQGRALSGGMRAGLVLTRALYTL